MKFIFHMTAGMAVNIDIPEITSMMQLDAMLRIDGCIRVGNDMWLNRNGISWIQNGDTVHLDKNPEPSPVDPGWSFGRNGILQ